MSKSKIPPEHVALVERVARGVARRIGSVGRQECDDLVQAGLSVYTVVIERYDPEKGASIEHYLSLRCRGAMLDYLRTLDTLSQRDRRLYKRLAKTQRKLMEELGREPTTSELADHLGLPSEKVRVIQSAPRLVSLEDSQSVLQLPAPIGDLEAIEVAVTVEKIASAAVLNAQQSAVLQMYREEKSQKEIAVGLGVTEARVSQVMGEVVLALRRAARRLNLKEVESTMGVNRHRIPQAAAYGQALKSVVKTFFTAEWISVGMINGLGIREKIERFEGSKFVEDAFKKGDLVEVPNGTGGKKYRLNHGSRNVIKAAMDVGLIADKEQAQKKAAEIFADADLFIAFCHTVHAHSSGDWFELAGFADEIWKDLGLDGSFWPLDSLELFMKALMLRAPGIIHKKGDLAQGTQYQIVLPVDQESEGQVAPVQSDTDSKGDRGDDEEHVSSGVPEFKTVPDGTSENVGTVATLPSTSERWRDEIPHDPAVRSFFLHFIGTAGHEGWTRTQELRDALEPYQGWGRQTPNAEYIIRDVLRALETDGLVRKQGRTRGRMYQLTDKGRQALARLISNGTADMPEQASLSVEPVVEPSPALPSPEPPSIVEDLPKPTETKVPQRDRVERELNLVNTEIQETDTRISDLGQQIAALQAQIRELSTQQAEFQASRSCYMLQRDSLEATLQQIEAAELAEKRRIEAEAAEIIAGLDPKVLEAIRLKLSGQD